MVLGFFETLQKWSDELKEFMLSNDHNVILFTCLFLVGVAIFAITFNALHKEN